MWAWGHLGLTQSAGAGIHLDPRALARIFAQ